MLDFSAASSTGEPQNTMEKGEENSLAEKPGEDSSKNSNQATGNEIYDIEQSTYEDKNVNISYPQIAGLNDTDKQKRINDLIEKETLKVLDYYKSVEQEFSLDVSYEIKWKGANLLSIQYTGLGYIKEAPYPKNIFYTINVDMNNVKKVRLADCINLDEDFVKKFKEAEYVAQDTELDSVIELIKESIENYDLINEFNNADSIGEGNPLDFFSYFTEDSLGLSVGVAHVIGDHAEFEIKYQDIKGNIKAENEIWKDFFKMKKQI